MNTHHSETVLLPLGQCFAWLPDLLWLYLGSSGIMTIAFVLMAITGIHIIRRSKHPVPHSDLLGLLILIFACSSIYQALEIANIWLQAYQALAWVKAITASITMTTGLILIPKIPELVSQKSDRAELYEAQRKLESMEQKFNQMSSVYQASLGREERIIQLKREVNQELVNQGHPERYSIYKGKN